MKKNLKYVDYLKEGNEGYPFRMVVDNLDEEDFEECALDFAKEYHKQQLNLHAVSQQRKLLIAFVDAWDKDEINVYNPPNEIADEFLAIYSG